MKIFERVVKYCKSRKKWRFAELPDWFLAGFGGMNFLVAGFYGMMLTKIVPDFVKTVNETEISLGALFFGVILGLYGLAVWFYGCIAARCHTLLYERWFK